MSSRIFQVGTSPAIDLRVSAGRLDLVSSPPGVIEIEVSGTGADYVAVDQNGDTISIREERHFFGGRTVNIRAAVPEGTHLEAVVASLDVFARVPMGRVVSRTASGDLDLGTVYSIEVKSASGDVKIDTCSDRCEISSASGDLRVHVVEGDLAVSSASGDISAGQVKGRVEAKTVSGDVRVACCAGGQIGIASMSGDVTVGIPKGTRVEAEIDSLSGDVTLPRKSIDDKAPTRSARLRAKTVSGDIKIDRVDAVGK